MEFGNKFLLGDKRKIPQSNRGSRIGCPIPFIIHGSNTILVPQKFSHISSFEI